MTPREKVCRDGKRYRTLARHLKETTGRRIVKIPLASGCTCPNRDGTKGVGGCAFCTEKGGGEFFPAGGTLLSQYEMGLSALRGKYPDADPIAYFQSFTNTYCAPDVLTSLLDETAALPGVRGIRIATRADCLPENIIEVLRQTAQKLPVMLELGLQTANDETARRINRGHPTKEFVEGFLRLHAAHLPVCVHLINGLPGDTKEDMLSSARLLGKLCPEGVKLHMLHLMRGSALGEEYQREPFPLLTKEEYVGIICRQLELLCPDTVIERLTGDGDRRTLIAPDWTRNKRAVLNAIDQELARLDTWQGRLWEESI